MAAATEAGAANVVVDLSDVANALIISLWRRVYSLLPDAQVGQGMTVCKAFKQELPALVKSIDISEYDTKVTPQQQLEKIAKTFTNLEGLTINLEYNDGIPKLDFTRVCFPHLKDLSLHCAPITSVDFTTKNTPKLTSLTLDNCQDVRRFRLELPELESVNIEFLEVGDERDFGRSLSSCPKLQQFTAYKLWGLGGRVHNLNLPECIQLSLYRSDDLEGLKLCAPKLAELELRACYGLECVRILPDPPAEDGQPHQPVPLRVNLINANIDRASKLHLKTHPRVTAPGGKILTKESQDELHRMMYGDDESGLEDDDSDDEDDDDGMMGMEGFLQMMQTMGHHHDPQMATVLAAMHDHGGQFGMFAHDEAEDENDDEWETDEEGGAADHAHEGHDHDDPEAAGAGGRGAGYQQMPYDMPAMLAMAMMGGMPPEMAMAGMQMMADGYGDDSGSGEYDDEFEQEDEDEYEDAEGGNRGQGGAAAGGPSCTIEEVE